ncbi:MAG: DUF4358 domain-containing protein [Lachnospiraceae bacterium]|nr:DUF4358 domain-containing protein [Lachnospiraceae bacterium]
MKRKRMTGILLATAIIMAGCAGEQKNYEGTEQVQLGGNTQSEVQDEAVNTIQVGSRYRVTDSMEELKDAVIEILGEDYWPDTLLTAEELAERTGISENMYVNFMAEYQHAEAGIDMMILIEAEEEEIDTIEKRLNEYREMLLHVYEKQPQNKAKVFASRIEVIDDYVCYVQLGADITALEAQGEDAMVSHCQEENERALDVIEKGILQS